MNDKNNWKKKIFAEIKDYFINVVYLFIFFSVFAWYQRLILAHHNIAYLHYGMSFIEALILGKVIMIGKFMRLGEKFEHKPLIISAIYKAFVFTVLVGIFSFIEYAIRGLIGGKGITGGIIQLLSKDKYEVLARNLVIFFAFIPFFAFKELERVIGEKKIRRLLFRKR